MATLIAVVSDALKCLLTLVAIVLTISQLSLHSGYHCSFWKSKTRNKKQERTTTKPIQRHIQWANLAGLIATFISYLGHREPIVLPWQLVAVCYAVSNGQLFLVGFYISWVVVKANYVACKMGQAVPEEYKRIFGAVAIFFIVSHIFSIVAALVTDRMMWFSIRMLAIAISSTILATYFEYSMTSLYLQFTKARKKSLEKSGNRFKRGVISPKGSEIKVPKEGDASEVKTANIKSRRRSGCTPAMNSGPEVPKTSDPAFGRELSGDSNLNTSNDLRRQARTSTSIFDFITQSTQERDVPSKKAVDDNDEDEQMAKEKRSNSQLGGLRSSESSESDYLKNKKQRTRGDSRPAKPQNPPGVIEEKECRTKNTDKVEVKIDEGVGSSDLALQVMNKKSSPPSTSGNKTQFAFGDLPANGSTASPRKPAHLRLNTSSPPSPNIQPVAVGTGRLSFVALDGAPGNAGRRSSPSIVAQLSRSRVPGSSPSQRRRQITKGSNFQGSSRPSLLIERQDSRLSASPSLGAHQLRMLKRERRDRRTYRKLLVSVAFVAFFGPLCLATSVYLAYAWFRNEGTIREYYNPEEYNATTDALTYVTMLGWYFYVYYSWVRCPLSVRKACCCLKSSKTHSNSMRTTTNGGAVDGRISTTTGFIATRAQRASTFMIQQQRTRNTTVVASP